MPEFPDSKELSIGGQWTTGGIPSKLGQADTRLHNSFMQTRNPRRSQDPRHFSVLFLPAAIIVEITE
jgi:hypothetical protein